MLVPPEPNPVVELPSAAMPVEFVPQGLPQRVVPVILLKLIVWPAAAVNDAANVGKFPMLAPAEVPSVPRPASNILLIPFTVTTAAKSELEAAARITPEMINLFII
jgi:hypothetical protein